MVNRIRSIPLPWGHTPYDTYNVNYEVFTNQAYKNPFIKAPFQEFVTDLKALKFEVHKDGKVSESIGARFVTKSLQRPHKELSFSGFIEYMAIHLTFGGRCLLYKSKGVLSRNIYIYSPNSFQIYRNENNLEIERIELGTTTVTGLELKNYHLIKMPNPNDVVAGFGSGYSQIEPLAMVGDMLNFLLIHNCTLLKNGGRTSGVYTLPENANKSQIDEIKKVFSMQNGAREAGKVAFIKGGSGSFQPFSTNPKDLDWVNGMIELQKIICRVMGIPEALVMNENSTYNNLEGFKKKVYEDTVIPFANMICEELTEFFKDDLEEGEVIAINTSNIKALQVDLWDKIEKCSKVLEGKVTINESIEIINKTFDLSIDTLKGKEGNRVLVSSNMMFLDELGVNYEPKT